MTIMKFILLHLLLNLVTFCKAEGSVTAPSTGTIWNNGGSGQISWSNLQGPYLCIVLNRINTVYHHTITCSAGNSGSYTWTPIDIPTQDGWPTSSSTDNVYQIQFYSGGGWNMGGTLVATSSPFAIVYGGNLVVYTTPHDGATTVVVVPPPTMILTITSPVQPNTVTQVAIGTTIVGSQSHSLSAEIKRPLSSAMLLAFLVGILIII